MSLRNTTTLMLLCSLAAISSASAGEIPGVSHRARLYDSAVHGTNVFVVGYPGLVLRSIDHGKSFQVVSVPTKDALFSIDINKAGVGAIASRGGLILTTSDGGATWSKTNALPDGAEGEDKPHLFAVDVLESGAIVAVGDFATIVQSRDKGKSWEKRSFDPSDPAASSDGDGAENLNEGFEAEARLTSVSFGDEQHGFVVGEFGMIIETSDGGVTWKRQHSPTDKLLFSVHALSATHAVIAGSEGTVAETRDGASWNIIETPTRNHLFGIWASEALCLVVGADGTVLRRSLDGAFKSVPTSVHAWLSSVALHDGQHGVVAGGLGYVLRTDDAGQKFAITAGE